jgi:uncharacterized protein YbaR (Trm112 family)
MNRRDFLLVLFGSYALDSLAQPATSKICPLCNGRLERVGSVKDDTNFPSKNMDVWNRSICGNLMYHEKSLICSRCWHAYREMDKTWVRSSELSASFYSPLSAAIGEFPLTDEVRRREAVVYTQEFLGAGGKLGKKDSIDFGCGKSDRLLTPMRLYAGRWNLSFNVRKSSSSVDSFLVTASTMQQAKLIASFNVNIRCLPVGYEVV